MNDELKNVVTKLAEKSAAAERPGDAMQLAQAALNVAHALATLENIKG
jgi:hypothetical protein